MRKLMLPFVTILATMFLLQGCLKDDDSYSLGKYWVTTGTIEKGDISPYVVVADNGDRLFPSATAVPHFKTKDGQRVWISYTILGDAEGQIDHYVRVNDLSEILTKGILELTPENADSIGHDPVTIRDYWFTGDFLTIRFIYGGGGRIHFINLVQDVENPVNEEGLPILEFRHNRNNDPYNYKMYGTVSFNLETLKTEEQDEVQFVLKAKSSGDRDDFEKVLTFKYDH
ncbi:NigD1/NigD2 family lipoprotein [Alkalitalea saponilacus]|nr:NigD-like protein [Alkalitalea saponilacus]ASB47741.1 hypothetical protein CDL62_00525 [Alkalitalea saponilacus]